jgi:hypothetical protein
VNPAKLPMLTGTNAGPHTEIPCTASKLIAVSDLGFI